MVATVVGLVSGSKSGRVDSDSQVPTPITLHRPVCKTVVSRIIQLSLHYKIYPGSKLHASFCGKGSAALSSCLQRDAHGRERLERKGGGAFNLRSSNTGNVIVFMLSEVSATLKKGMKPLRKITPGDTSSKRLSTRFNVPGTVGKLAAPGYPANVTSHLKSLVFSILH